MTTNPFVKAVSKATGIEKNTVSAVLDGTIKYIVSELTKGRRVKAVGLGTFYVKHRAEKKARNIKKNTIVVIPEHDAPLLKFDKQIVDALSKASPNK